MFIVILLIIIASFYWCLSQQQILIASLSEEIRELEKTQDYDDWD